MNNVILFNFFNNNANIFFRVSLFILLDIILNPRLIIIRLFQYYRNSNEFSLGAVAKMYNMFTIIFSWKR
jgi:hypothetical protein